jgi:hypothetical protein
MFSKCDLLPFAVLDWPQQLGHRTFQIFLLSSHILLSSFLHVLSHSINAQQYWGAKGWFYITTDYQPGCSWAVPRLEEKQPTITCSSNSASEVTCPADTQCCCDKRSLIKKTCALLSLHSPTCSAHGATIGCCLFLMLLQLRKLHVLCQGHHLLQRRLRQRYCHLLLLKHRITHSLRRGLSFCPQPCHPSTTSEESKPRQKPMVLRRRHWAAILRLWRVCLRNETPGTLPRITNLGSP